MNPADVLDTVSYVTGGATLLAIPPPRQNSTGDYTHDISRWDLRAQPLWRGQLTIVEREDFGPNADPEEPLALRIEFGERSQPWALAVGGSNVIATRSTKLYVVLVQYKNTTVGLGLQLQDQSQANEFALALQDYRAQREKMRFYAREASREADRKDAENRFPVQSNTVSTDEEEEFGEFVA